MSNRIFNYAWSCNYKNNYLDVNKRIIISRIPTDKRLIVSIASASISIILKFDNKILYGFRVKSLKGISSDRK